MDKVRRKSVGSRSLEGAHRAAGLGPEALARVGWIRIGVAWAGLALWSGTTVAFGAEETVVPAGSIPAPVGVAEPSSSGSASDFYLASTQQCYGQNNRASSNTARGTADSTISQIYEFKVEGSDSSVWRRIDRKGNVLRGTSGPAFTCSRVPNIQPGVSDGASCHLNPAGLQACGWGTSATQTLTYRCSGAAHATAEYPPEMRCSVSNGQVSCAAHANGTQHHCRLHQQPSRYYSRQYRGVRYSPAEIRCSHRLNADYASTTAVFQSTDGVNWTPDSSAVIELSRPERFVVKVGLSAGRPIERLVSMKYVQDVPANAGVCAFGGCDGPLTHREVSRAVKPHSIDVAVSFAGADGFCGGFHSPLMLFFKGEKMPSFSGVSRMKMGNEGSSYSWPEPGSQGWLLAHDIRGDGKITDESQLFGENTMSSNGFAALALHDQNGDGRIDEQDPIYENLLLWNDRNGDSVSQKRELRSLAEAGVVSISLEYSTASDIAIGDRARAKQKGRFSYRKKGARDIEEGAVIDIWFAELK